MGHGIRAVSQAQLVNQLKLRGFIASERLERVMEIVDRRKFVTCDPYANEPCRVNKHSVSTPQFHAQLLGIVEGRCGPGLRAADIGTGTGYLAAVLAELGCAEVVATEADCEMHALASANLQGYSNVNLIKVGASDPILPGDVGQLDSIIVSPAFASEEAAIRTLEPMLNDQGVAVCSSRLDDSAFQQLMIVRKNSSGLSVEKLMRVACEMMASTTKMDDPGRWLESWKDRFADENGRQARKEDLVADPDARDMFKAFSASRRYKP